MSTRVLIIEDNPASMALMVLLLEAYGHATLQSRDGVAGIEVARCEFPDLIICDVHLPKMDGYGVVNHLKSDPGLRAIPVIAVTALAMSGDREKLLAAGFDAYIGKPIEPETFVEQVDRFLAADKRSSGIRQRLADDPDCPFSLESRNARILVVDDSPINRELIRSTLEPFGYDLTMAATVRRGLSILDDAAADASFDLILSDLHMPVEDGYSFIRAVKADPRLAHTPFMFISASYGSHEEIRLGLELGASCFIRRPIDPQLLLEHIEACLNVQPKGVYGDHTDR